MKIKTLFIAVFFITLSASLFALGGGTSNADFLKIGVGARPSAMGEAYSAVGGEASASFWNPALIAYEEKINATIMHLSWYEGTNYEYLSAVMPFTSDISAGISVNYFWIPAFNSTVDSFGNALEPDNNLISYDMAVTASVAKIMGDMYTRDFTIGNISLGLNVTYIQRKVLDYQLPAVFMADLGLAANITDSLRGALVVQNIGSAAGNDQSPLNVKLGMSHTYDFSKDFGILVSGDINKPIDTKNPEYVKWLGGLGVEVKIIEIINLRAGYKFGRQDESYTVGAGLKVKDMGSLDFAFAPHASLGNSMRFSLSLMFGNSVPRPAVGAPKAPVSIKAIAGDKVVSVGWAPNQEANIAGYNIYYRKKGTGKFELLNKEPVIEQEKYKAILENDITYEFAVSAINNRGLESVLSEKVLATPKKYVPVKPPVIKGIEAKIEGNGVIIVWDESKDTNVTGYNMYFKTKDETRFRKLNKQPIKEGKATLAGLKPGMLYFFKVTSVSKDGVESDFSEAVTAKLAPKGGSAVSDEDEDYQGTEDNAQEGGQEYF